MKIIKRPFFLTLAVATILLSYSCVSHAAKNVGFYWSGFDSQDGLNVSASSGYVVVDAADARDSNLSVEGIGPFQGNGPSFSDSGLVMYDEDEDAPGGTSQYADVAVVWKEIKIAAGDTLSSLAEKHGVAIKDIMQANELTNQHVLREGQTLYIPDSSEYVLDTMSYIRRLKNDEITKKKQAAPFKITDYTIKPGDTLWSVANTFNLDVNSLFGCNKLSDASVLKVGATVRVPNQDGILITVKSGQTVEKLAKEYGIFPEAILSANMMSSGAALVVGKEIFLPEAKAITFIESGGKKGAVTQNVKQMVTAKQGFGWPVVGKISSPFGWRKDPVRGGRDFHTGLDIKAPKGRPIVASAAGRVVHSGWMGGYGKTIVISHPNGMTTLYAHCSQLIAKTGTNVKRGQRVALVGSTGRSTGNHVHFEVRRNGTPMNPLKFIR